MTAPDIDEARNRWIEERASFQQFADKLQMRLREIALAQGISAEISGRAKEVHSLVKKLLAKPKHNYDSLPDKVGVRIILRYRSELPEMEGAVRAVFGFRGTQDKAEALGVDRLGYQSIHIDGLHFLAGDELAKEFPAEKYFAELQVRTLAQHLWAEISHDTFYKNDELISTLQDDVQRRVNLMAGQVEVADREFDRMNSELPTAPEAGLLRELEKLYYRLTAERPNIQLSLDVIRLLLPLYGGISEAEIMQGHVSPTFARSEKMLRHVYASSDDSTNVSAFFFQPEALLIYDLLKTDPDATLTVWNQQYPSKELERVAVAFGLSLD